MKIEDGTGTGKVVKVTATNKMEVRAVSIAHQHNVSEQNSLAFQTSATLAIANTKTNIMLIQNSSDTQDMVITYLRLATIGAAAANAAAFWTIETGGSYASGGTAITPTNMKTGSSVSASGLFYNAAGSSIVTAGTHVEIDRNYASNEMVKYNKEGALILPKNQSLLITHTGSTTAGTAYCRVSFFYESD